jgi:hypothetical protein
MFRLEALARALIERLLMQFAFAKYCNYLFSMMPSIRSLNSLWGTGAYSQSG